MERDLQLGIGDLGTVNCTWHPGFEGSGPPPAWGAPLARRNGQDIVNIQPQDILVVSFDAPDGAEVNDRVRSGKRRGVKVRDPWSGSRWQ
eukprot:COSAG04_NODE_2134_length_4727_cov_1.982930_5_plen_90_part_00